MSPYEIVALMLLLINVMIGIVSLCYKVFKDAKK